MCSWVTPDKHPFSPLCCHQVTVQSPETSLEGIFLFHLQQHARQPCQRSGTSAPGLGWHQQLLYLQGQQVPGTSG